MDTTIQSNTILIQSFFQVFTHIQEGEAAKLVPDERVCTIILHFIHHLTSPHLLSFLQALELAPFPTTLAQDQAAGAKEVKAKLNKEKQLLDLETKQFAIAIDDVDLADVRTTILVLCILSSKHHHLIG